MEQLSKEQYETRYTDQYTLPYNQWLRVDNKQVRNHWLSNTGKLIKSKVVQDIIDGNVVSDDQQTRIDAFYDHYEYISDNTKRSLVYFIQSKTPNCYIQHFEKQKTLPRMSLEWCIHTCGTVAGTAWFEARQAALNASHVAPGRASKESLVVFEPLCYQLTKANIKYNIGDNTHKEYILYDNKSQKRYAYDFCIPTANLIFEYHGSAYHPDPSWSSDKWNSWTECRSKISADEKYKADCYKKQLAESKGFTVIELYSDNGVDYNQHIIDTHIKEVLDVPLFDKCVMFGDIHLGLRGNSKVHNEICLEYIDWLISESTNRGVRTCIFLGDYFHNRAVVNIDTLNYGIEALTRLSDHFEKVIMITGNHDLYYRQKRDTHSIAWATTFPNVQLVNNITEMNDCLFLPFLVGDEWKELEQMSAKYVFGHLELPGYKLNSLVEMPDHGRETDQTFSKCEYVFSGHFHKRQQRVLDTGAQIHYIGNPFPHNFNDAWDDARGCVFMEWDGIPEYANWEAGPKFRTANMSDLLEDPKFYLDYRVTAKVNLDIELTAEEISFIRETYKTYFKMSDFKATGMRAQNLDLAGVETDVAVESVDQVVIDQINAMDTNALDKALLIEIYTNL